MRKAAIIHSHQPTLDVWKQDLEEKMGFECAPFNCVSPSMQFLLENRQGIIIEATARFSQEKEAEKEDFSYVLKKADPALAGSLYLVETLRAKGANKNTPLIYTSISSKARVPGILCFAGHKNTHFFL